MKKCILNKVFKTYSTNFANKSPLTKTFLSLRMTKKVGKRKNNKRLKDTKYFHAN